MLRKKHCIAAKAIRAPSVLSGFLLNRVSQPVSRKGQLCGKLSIWFRKVFNGCILYFTHTKKRGGGGGIIRQSSYTYLHNKHVLLEQMLCNRFAHSNTSKFPKPYPFGLLGSSNRVGWIAYKLCSRFVHISVKRIRSSPLLRKSISDNQIGLKHFATNRSFVQVHKDVTSGLKTVFACRFLKCSRIVWCNNNVCWFLNESAVNAGILGFINKNMYNWWRKVNICLYLVFIRTNLEYCFQF